MNLLMMISLILKKVNLKFNKSSKNLSLIVEIDMIIKAKILLTNSI